MTEALAERVLIVVFDGLRPDLIPGRMPALEGFLAEATVFDGARSVFPSLTRVATTSIATGTPPRAHGIVGNAFHAPEIVTGGPFDTSDVGHLARAGATWGRVVAAPTLGERLAAAGRGMAVFHAGSAGAAYLINPEAAALGQDTFSIHGAAATQTPQAFHRAAAAHGPPPAPAMPCAPQIDYLARVASASLAEAGAAVTVVWLPEPDTSFHYLEIGSPGADAAQAAADAAFAALLDRAAGGRRRTAVIAMSDHGQIATTGLFDLPARFAEAGLRAAARPIEGDRLALTLGACGEIRPLAETRRLVNEAAALLRETPEIGMIFAREDVIDVVPGALPLACVGLDSPRAAPLVYVMRSDDAPDARGLPGRGLMTGGGVPVGGGMHGGLNRRELSVLLALAVPGAGRGGRDPRACGLMDVAATALALLGLDPGADARPLCGPAWPDAGTETLRAEAGGFAQTLARRRVGPGHVLEEGGRA